MANTDQIKITSNFDGGNIEVVEANDAKNIQLKIQKDQDSDNFQWFYFRMQGVEDKPCTLKIVNAHEASYPEGWDNYQARVSYDRVSWFQVPTSYDGKNLIIDFIPEFNSVYIAYFTPYSYEQHQDLVHAAQFSAQCELSSIGTTTEGRDIDLLTVGKPTSDKKKIWIIARQHAGETMAEWFMQGFISRLLNEDDAASSALLSKAVFYIVPNINVDGSIKGHLRGNGLGIDLNREWGKPSKERSPEVYYVKEKMRETGVDMNLDIHGDESLPYIFPSGTEGIPSFDDKLKFLADKFYELWQSINPDFQSEHGYPKNEPGKANLNICSKNIAEEFKCLSQTIEMPFQDNANNLDKVFGWSAERSEKLGESLINTLLLLVDDL